MKLKDKVAIVTGSSRGIGCRIAEIFAENGANVVINYLHAENVANEVATNIAKQTNTKPLVVQADMADVKQIDNLVNKTVERFGRIDILVNNAGIAIRTDLSDTTEEIWDRVLDVNLKGKFFCAKAVAEVMASQKTGNIINISSMRGITGSKRSVHYAVSMAGVNVMTKSLAAQLAPFIRVNGIAPGYTMTDLHAHLGKADIQKIESTVPLKRFATVDEIASIALFLASDESAYITGETIVASGGVVMR
ncbi:MAG: hypothetical protein B6242_10125 [Anaerolineaceae bacterium 4572_78]|nr:MAG: hypothetical protein B6242_10125 [Anaerolineaceae bacterium 4572_78]